MNKTRSLFLVPLFLLACLFAYNWYANEVTIEYDVGTYKGEASLGRIVWNGVPHGQGTFTLPDGSKYAGEWKDDKRHGQGTFTLPDGSKYVGEWRYDNFHGQGILTFADEDKYFGEFKDGKKDGQGTYTWSNGSKYVGEHKNDNPWNGTEYDKDGNVTATWSEGVMTVK